MLLEATIPGPLDEQVKARILAETRGNPLALMQLPRGLTPADLAGGFGLPDARPLTNRIEQSFLQRANALPPRNAAAPLDRGRRAARRCEPALARRRTSRHRRRSRVASRGRRPARAWRTRRFPHPLIRSAVYRASDPSDRCDVHRALADSTDPVVDPDRCAWHRAHATTTPDEAVAAEMERSADRARGRGGLAAAAAFLQRAAELTPDPALRVERSLAAAQAKLDVADAASASVLLAVAELGPLNELQRARLERLRARGRVHQPPRARCAVAAARGGTPARSARRRARPRNVPRGDRVGDARRTSRHRPGRTRSGRGRRRVATGPDRGRGRPAPRRPRHAVHRGVYAIGRTALARAARVRRTRLQRRRHALAVAGLSLCAGALGRRPLVHARNTR